MLSLFWGETVWKYVLKPQFLWPRMAWFAVGGAGEGAVWGTVCAAGGIDGWELAGMRVTAFFFQICSWETGGWWPEGTQI